MGAPLLLGNHTIRQQLIVAVVSLAAEQERLPRPDSEPRQQSLPAGGLDDVTAQVAGLSMSYHAPDPFAGALLVHDLVREVYAAARRTLSC